MKRQVGVIQERKTGKLLTDQIYKAIQIYNAAIFYRYIRFAVLLWRKLDVLTVGYFEDYYEKDPNKQFLRKFETKARYTFELNFLQKRDYPFYIKQCSYQVLKCIIDFINKNCQVAFIFNNLQYLTKILRAILLSPLPMLFASI